MQMLQNHMRAPKPPLHRGVFKSNLQSVSNLLIYNQLIIEKVIEEWLKKVTSERLLV